MTQRYTNIRLLSGVPFDNNYEHTRWFQNLAEQTAYFMAMTPVKQGNNYSYQRESQSFRVDANKDTLLSVNYIMYKNNENPNKWMYGFVTQLEYMNDSTTQVVFEIDVIQTWRFNFSFRESFIERQHSPRNTGSLMSVNTIEENLNYGTEYDLAFSGGFHASNSINFLVVITSEEIVPTGVDARGGGTTVGSPSPFSYYILPVDTVGNVYGIGDSGSETLGTMKEYMSILSKSEFFTNKIIGMYMTAYCGINFDINKADKTALYTNTNNIKLSKMIVKDKVGGGVVNKRFPFYKVDHVSSFETKEIVVDLDFYQRFKDKYNYSETKCYMYPYCVVELADMKGNVLTIKPEYLNNGELKVTVMGSLGISNKVSYVPVGYNTVVKGTEQILSDFALIDVDPTDIGVVTDYASAMMQGQRNSLMAQQANIKRDYQTGVQNSAFSMAGAVFSAAATKNPMIGMTNAMGSIQQANNTLTTRENATGLLNAKLDDINNVPPSVSQMGSNTSFSYGNFQNTVYVRYKMAKPEYMKRLDKHFKLFGTKTLDIKNVPTKTRACWNFLKTKEVNIVGQVNNTHLTRIKEIFDSGITLWHDNDILNYNRNNPEV